MSACLWVCICCSQSVACVRSLSLIYWCRCIPVYLPCTQARPENGLGDSPVVIEPSSKDIGTVFIGTGGRGIFYRNVTADLQAALLACEGDQ